MKLESHPPRTYTSSFQQNGMWCRFQHQYRWLSLQIEQQAFKTIFAEVISKDEASDSSLQMGCIGDCVILHPENKIIKEYEKKISISLATAFLMISGSAYADGNITGTVLIRRHPNLLTSLQSFLWTRKRVRHCLLAPQPMRTECLLSPMHLRENILSVSAW